MGRLEQKYARNGTYDLVNVNATFSFTTGHKSLGIFLGVDPAVMLC